MATEEKTNQENVISHWPDIDELTAKFQSLVHQPMRPVRREKMQQYLDYYDTRCVCSKESTEEAKKYIPGGVQHNLAFNYPFPLSITKVAGAYMWDLDGNRYTDFLQAGGPTMLGSNPPAVRDRVVELLQDCGPVTGLFHEYELELAKVINRFMPSIEMFRMLGSGTEGVMAALRAARAFTGKRRVIKAGGAYHGWSDQMVFGLHIPGTGSFEAAGIPQGCYQDTQEFFPGSIEHLASLLEKNSKEGGTAAVIVEPVGPESGTRPVKLDFNHKVRELCDQYGTLLIFDEVVTGFRLGMGGAQGFFGVKPDLTVFGKCVAGGFPSAGGLGGRNEIMERLAAGLASGTERAYVGGTLSANPLSCAAGYFSLLEMEKTGAAAKAAQAGDRLSNGLQALIDKYGLPYVTYNLGSITHLQTSGVMLLDLREPQSLAELGPRNHMMQEMGAAFTAEGVVTLAGSRLYTSLADTDEVIDEALAAFERVFQNVE